MIFNKIKCHVNTSLGLVGGMHPLHAPVSAPGNGILFFSITALVNLHVKQCEYAVMYT